MKSPSYRFVTLCPQGISAALAAHINKPTGHPDHPKIKDMIALDLIGPYVESDLAFAGSVIAWARTSYLSDMDLSTWLQCLDRLTVHQGPETVQFECFLNKVKGGTAALGGFYPLASNLSNYQTISLLARDEERNQLFERSYAGILSGALETDPAGMMITLVAEDEMLAESKLHEAISLLLNQPND
jgi:hypothetical protein